ncbi:MAG: phosphate regulon sensor histidine kinase PhoR [Pseudomonadota bacterium]|nr:phosphate regulon sensor histidine kinase PhoR [Pseudomonadota bacterium]MDP1906468.1 phosphate regulon sensor histidine kinase PhoR [Pseudomonadota bacterium]MDP2353940.1 phosphate regulon sensor histidine kinase PhoR [Pseudomonadota bacterium]
MSFWWRPLLFILGIGFLAAILSNGRPAGSGWMLFAAGLLIYLAYHLRQLDRLSAWLSSNDRPPLSSQGVWGDAFYRLGKLLRERRGAQRKTAADLERMLEATRSLPDGVIILDQDNRIVWLNDAAQRLLGLSAQRDLGQFVLYLLRNSRFAEWLLTEDLARALTLESPTARRQTLSMQIVPLPRRQKMLVARDITEMTRVEAMRRDFVANVSHELRTPITVILGFLEAFEDMPDTPPGEFRKHIPLMREQSDRIRRLIDDLLALAKLESEPDTKDETVDMPALVRLLADEAETLSQGRHRISLELESRAGLIGNQRELYSALANLVTNAVRYTPEGGQIRVNWRTAENGGAHFSVIDTGDGIEAQHIPRLTERFYRVDRGRSRATGGTGLGLAIVKHVLQRHQARLKVSSVIGKGSTFTAQFPRERVISLPPRPE